MPPVIVKRIPAGKHKKFLLNLLFFHFTILFMSGAFDLRDEILQGFFFNCSKPNKFYAATPEWFG